MFQNARRDKMLQDGRHDPYRSRVKYPEPTVCGGCRAVFQGGRWSWGAAPREARTATCPACQRIADRNPAARGRRSRRAHGLRHRARRDRHDHGHRGQDDDRDPAYISPEQAQGRPLDGRSDLYALGVTLYKAATGELPFRSSDWFELARMHVEEVPVPPTTHRPTLSQRFERVVLRCLAKHPDDRYPSADALGAELEALVAGERRTKDMAVPRLRATPAADPAASGARRWGIRIAAVLIVAFVAVVMVWLARR